MLEVGNFITVTNWKPLPNGHVDSSYIGDCLELLVIDKQFIRVWNHSCNMLDKPMTLNLKQVNVQFLSREFVASVTDERKPLTPDQKKAAYLQYLKDGYYSHLTN